MTSIQTPRPPAPASRPGAPTPPGAAPGVVSVDPIQLAKKHKWLLIASVIAGVVFGVAAYYALLRLYPVYSAEVIWECFPQDTKLVDLAPEGGSRDELEKFMATQAQIMMSSSIIDKAVVHPDLERNASEWRRGHMARGNFDQASAARELEKRLGAGVMGDTQLVRLSFWAHDPKNAAAIANVVADSYLRDRRARVESEQLERRELLSRNITAIDTDIESLQTKRKNLMGEFGVDSLNEQLNKSQAMLNILTAKLIETRGDIEAYSSQLRRLTDQLKSPTGIVYDDAMRMAADRDPIVERIRNEIALFEGELMAMKARGIGENHLDYRSLESRRRGKEESRKEEYEKALRRQFDSTVEQLRSAVAALEAQSADVLKKREEEERRSTELANARAAIDDIKEEITAKSQQKAELGRDLNNLQALKDLDTAYRIRKFQDAKSPRTVTFPRLFIMIPLGVLLVTGLVVGLLVLVELVDQRVKGASDIAMISRTKVLGVIPHAAEDPAAPARVETVFRDQPGGVLAESFRQARGAVAKVLAQKEHKSLLVVSGLPGSGASTVVVNLAYALAAAEHRVLVIDANFRRPTISKTLGLQDAPGLADVLANAQALSTTVQGTDNPNVAVLAAGSASNRKIERLATPAMSNLLREAGQVYDTILIDAAPAVIAGDAVALANRCDASILVVKAFAEKRGMVARLRNELGECRAEFLGVLVNGVRASAGGYLRGNIRATHEYQNGNA